MAAKKGIFPEATETAPSVYRLRGLGMACTVLQIGAHPDDEDSGLLTYLAHKFGVRVVFWSATRGEGGQNRVGPYREEALGVYRTWESLAARAVDGGECLFGPFYDFGFSKNGAEALARWGHTAVVRELVRVIRLVQPHIIVARWTGEPAHDGHGHHQAIGQATLEAWAAAGDPDQFPELQAQGLPAWQPLKLYHSTMGDFQPGEDVTIGAIDPAWERAGIVRINTGEFDPAAGRTYQEQAWLALNQHQTQAMGNLPAPGDFFYYFALAQSLVPVPDRETTFFEGLAPTLTGLADHPGGGSAALHDALIAARARANEAFQTFRTDDPLPAAGPLLAGLTALREIQAGLADPRQGLSSQARQALDLYLGRKLLDFEAMAAGCLGLQLECLSEQARLIPSQRFRLSARLWNHRQVQVDRVEFEPCLPEDWSILPLEPEVGLTKALPAPACAAFEVTVSEMASLTCPYWLTRPRAGYVYDWPDSEQASRPFGSPPAHVECRVTLGPHWLNLRRAAVQREAFSGGYRELPVAVIPPISLHPETSQAVLQARQIKQRRTLDTAQDFQNMLGKLHQRLKDQSLELRVVARNNSAQALEGSLTLEVPAGWHVTPEHVELTLPIGEAQIVRFTVSIPASTPEGHYPLQYKIRCGRRDYGVVLTPVRLGAPGLAATDGGNCLKEECIITPAQVVVHLIGAQFAPELRYAYIQGAKEELLEALRPFDLTFHLIGDAEMSHLDLSTFDMVVVGPNAYLTRAELRKNAARFLEYVNQGGTLIVQYQGYDYQNQDCTPYPFRYNQPHDRVTQEHAPVHILEPGHFLFRFPNVIGPDDFNGWVRERGLYFFGQWDKRYRPLLACSDPGEPSKMGGLIECQYGQGTFLYCGYSFFRQLPAGVPGAFRLWANILALPQARVVERGEFLAEIPLFSALNREQLEQVARLMSERWVEAGTFICRQGEVGHELYVVYQGEVEVLQGLDDQAHVIDVATAGDCLGELSVLGDIPRLASLRARGDVHLLVIASAQFQTLLRRYADLSIQMMRVMANKLAGSEG